MDKADMEMVSASAPQGIHKDYWRTSKSLLFVVLLTALTACASSPDKRASVGRDTDAGLYRWVDSELGPYLATQLSQHPRFKGEPVLVVSMNGADVRADIDALTQSVRTRIMDQLLSEPGINLVWRPAMRPWQHHRAETPRDCNNISQANYYIGIEITPTPDRDARVSIRALDLLDRSWVSGFGKTWRGTLTAAQHQAWQQSRIDEYLRGLRVLPFTESETDLLADYLAENLACLLLRQGVDRPLVYLDTGETNHKVLLKVAVGVQHYLVRRQAIRLASKSSQADLLLSANLNPIDQGLHHLWLSAKPANGAQPMAGIDTDGYILLSEAPRTAGSRGTKHGGLIRQTSRATPNGAVISELRIKQQHDLKHCNTLEPWAHDESLVPSDGLPSANCYGLEFELYQAARVYVLNHRSDDELIRLLPSSCRPQRARRSVVPANTTVWVPYEHKGTKYAGAATGQPSLESFYAVAVKQSHPAHELEAHLRRLPEACGDNTLPQPESPDLEHWLAQLDTLVNRLGDRVAWRGLRMRRAP